MDVIQAGLATFLRTGHHGVIGSIYLALYPSCLVSVLRLVSTGQFHLDLLDCQRKGQHIEEKLAPAKIELAKVINICEGSEHNVTNKDNAYASEGAHDKDEDEMNVTLPKWEAEIREETSDVNDDAAAGTWPITSKN